MARTFVAVCGASLQDALAKATPADTIHTAFPPPGHYPRLTVVGERWHEGSWTTVDTNGRWRWRAAERKVDHRPSPAEAHPLTCPETKYA